VTRTTKSTLEFPYSRTVGPVVGAFLAGLREHRILGVRNRDGQVLVPPLEYDPHTGEALEELVEVGPAGTVESWTWVPEPTRSTRWRTRSRSRSSGPTTPTPR
jgi:uncharacterized OB-fold protein